MSRNQTDHFQLFDEEILIEMAQYYPTQLKKMCMLISLDLQLEKENFKSYEKDENSSSRGDVC